MTSAANNGPGTAEPGGRRPCRPWRRALAILASATLAAPALRAQSLRYNYQTDLTRPSPRFEEDRMFTPLYEARARIPEPPDDATVLIGPFYSTWLFTQQAGYRYVHTEGTGVDFLVDHRRIVVEDGDEFPLISTLNLRNYVRLTERTDLDLSLAVRYAHYPLGTQDDEFYVTMAPEGVFGNVSAGLDLTRFVRAVLYDSLVYRMDYVDTRGIIDEYGGQEYKYLQNVLGLTLDWQFAKNKDIRLWANREDFMPRTREFEYQERVTYREGAGYEQQVFLPNLLAGARAEFSQNRYTAPDRPDTRQDDYTAYLRYHFGLGEGGEHGAGMRLTEVSTLTAGLGYAAGAGIGTEVAVQNDQERRDFSVERQGSLVGHVNLTTHLRRDLTHSFEYRRGLRTGFDSAFELYDQYAYRIWWQHDLTTVSGHSVYRVVYPSSDLVNGYSDWTSGIDFSYPLADRVALLGTTAYSQRRNEAVAATGVVDEEWSNDYATWLSRLGTSVAVNRKINFVTYAEHIQRWSDANELEYVRDIFEAMFVYRHQF